MENKRQIVGFDYIKILAATLLVFHHYQQVFDCRFAYINFYGGTISFGYLVELFFIISGFLTVYSEQNRTVVRGQQFVHKLLRVYPMAVLFQLVMCVTGVNFSHTYMTMEIFLVSAWLTAVLVWKFIDLPIRRKIRSFEKECLKM